MPPITGDCVYREQAGDGMRESNVICGENGGIEKANRAALNSFKSAYPLDAGNAIYRKQFHFSKIKVLADDIKVDLNEGAQNISSEVRIAIDGW